MGHEGACDRRGRGRRVWALMVLGRPDSACELQSVRALRPTCLLDAAGRDLERLGEEWSLGGAPGGHRNVLATAEPDIACLVESWATLEACQADRVGDRLGFEHRMFVGDWDQGGWKARPRTSLRLGMAWAAEGVDGCVRSRLLRRRDQLVDRDVSGLCVGPQHPGSNSRGLHRSSPPTRPRGRRAPRRAPPSPAALLPAVWRQGPTGSRRPPERGSSWPAGRVVGTEVPEQLGDVTVDRRDRRQRRGPSRRRRQQRDSARQVVDLEAQLSDALRSRCFGAGHRSTPSARDSASLSARAVVSTASLTNPRG